jgi:hypothetical protein
VVSKPLKKRADEREREKKKRKKNYFDVDEKGEYGRNFF